MQYLFFFYLFMSKISSYLLEFSSSLCLSFHINEIE